MTNNVDGEQGCQTLVCGPTLAQRIIIFGLQERACRYYTANVLTILHIPECSAGISADIDFKRL